MTTAFPRAPLRVLVQAGLALSLTLAGFSATTAPARAAAERAVHVAALTAPLAEPRSEILDGVMWRCTGETCRGADNGSRAITACSRVARKFGPVARFTTAGGELKAEDLARCNGK